MQNENKIYSETPHLIFCEGVDAYFFLIWFLDFIKQQNSAFASFRVYNFGGINDLSKYLRIFSKLDGFCKIVRSICVVRDAETNASSAVQSIRRSLDKCKFAVPDTSCSKAVGTGLYPQIATGFVLFPEIGERPESGTLEDLCLRILATENVETMLEHVNTTLEQYRDQLPRLHKNRLHTFFSLTDKFVSLRIGEAAKCRAFDYEKPEMRLLKSFLLRMVDGCGGEGS